MFDVSSNFWGGCLPLDENGKISLKTHLGTRLFLRLRQNILDAGCLGLLRVEVREEF